MGFVFVWGESNFLNNGFFLLWGCMGVRRREVHTYIEIVPMSMYIHPKIILSQNHAHSAIRLPHRFSYTTRGDAVDAAAALRE